MTYRAGWAKREIQLIPRGYAMHGFAAWRNRAWGQHSPLWARALCLVDAQGGALYFCCLDLGYVTHAMRHGIIQRLRKRWGDDFDADRLVLTCTHTHSGPGGCTHDALYNFVTPGFVPEHVEAIVSAASQALLQALTRLEPTKLSLCGGRFDDEVPVAWNRSLAAYNRNPDVTRRTSAQTHLALDRGMQVLALRRAGKTQALLSLFGVHATCVGNRQTQYDGDNKGYAAAQAERALQVRGVENPLAIFAQATAGDVSPYYHGPGDKGRRAAIRGDVEYAYAEKNARYQSDLALSLLEVGNAQPVAGAIDAIFSYVDFTDIRVDPAYADGVTDATTSDPCHGVSFFTGTPIDGPGMSPALGLGAKALARALKQRRMRRLKHYPESERDYLQRLYRAQGPKDILMEDGRKRVLGQKLAEVALPSIADPLLAEMKRQARSGALDHSAMVPTVLPLQIIALGPLALVCCPGEFTTTAGRRLLDSVRQKLAGRGIERVLICTYCNDYMGYVTTFEEYQQQAYEGGHTIYGQWTLAAFQTRFDELARAFCKPAAQRQHDRDTRPEPVPEDELARRSNLQPPDR